MASSETCSRCGQEVRWGWRDGQRGYWHRETVDHVAIFGHIQTAEDRAGIERQLDLPRVRIVTKSKKIDGETIVEESEEAYTTREVDLLRYRKSKKFRDAEALEEVDDGDEEVATLPPVEVWCHPAKPDSFPPRSGIRQVISLVIKSGWELRRLTHARGPYVGSKGECLSISDTIVLGARGPALLDGLLDEVRPVVVASWRDGGFDHGYIGLMKSGQQNYVEPVNATELRTWIKENTA